MRTVASFHVILGGAPDAFLHQFSTGHGHKMSALPLNDLQVSNHKLTVESDRTERSQTIVDIGNQFDSNFGNLHGVTSG
jgi:hypothetical protein